MIGATRHDNHSFVYGNFYPDIFITEQYNNWKYILPPLFKIGRIENVTRQAKGSGTKLMKTYIERVGDGNLDMR